VSKFLRTHFLDNSAPSGSSCGFSGSGAARQVKWYPKLSKCIQAALLIVVLGGAPGSTSGKARFRIAQVLSLPNQ
jgi:hypothetical protein